MGLYDLLTVIGSRQLVAGNPFPPLGDSASQSQGAPAGVLIHEAAGCRSLRRFERISAGGGCSCLPAVSLAFPRARSARAWWYAPAGEWGVVGYVAAPLRPAAPRTAAHRVAPLRGAPPRDAARLNATFLTDHQTTRNQMPLRHAPLRSATHRVAAHRNVFSLHHLSTKGNQ